MEVTGNLIALAWGTEIRLVVSRSRDGQIHKVTLVSENGERVNLGSFIGIGDKPLKCTFDAELSREEATKLEVRTTPGGELVFFAKLPEEPRVALFGIFPWPDQGPQNESTGPSAEDPPEKPKDDGSGGGTPNQESSPESDVKRPSPGGEPSASAAASPTASASASAGGTPVVPAAPPPEDQTPAESQYGGGN